MEQQIVELSLADRFLTWFETNRKNVITGAIVALVAAVAYFIYLDSQEKKRIAAGQSLSRALMNEFTTSGRVASSEAMLKVATEQAGTEAGAQALLLAAGALFNQGKYAEAQAQFEKFGRDYPGHQFASQASLGIASSLHSQGKLEESINAYRSADRPGASTSLQAKFGLGSVYAAQGKGDLALSQYEGILMESRGDRNNPLVGEAELRVIELRSKLPVPAAVPTTAPAKPMTLLTSTNAAPAK